MLFAKTANGSLALMHPRQMIKSKETDGVWSVVSETTDCWSKYK